MSSLRTLVSWYQDHSLSCPQEPQLQALDLQPDFSAAATWRCDSDHSFVQYLCSPPWEGGDSEQEEESSGDSASETDVAAKGAASRRRKFRGAE